MFRRTLAWLSPFVLAVACWLLHAFPLLAQDAAQPQEERPPPVFQYLLAILFAIGLLVILCMPSRKGASGN